MAGIDGYWLVALIAVTWLGTATLWGTVRRVPKTKRGKVGFAVAITAEPGTKSVIRSDFVLALRKHLEASPPATSFQLIEVPDYAAAKLFTRDDADRLRRKIRAHFVILGRVRRRLLKGEEHDILDIIGLVAHAPLSSDRAERLSREFSELLPSRYQMKFADSFPAIEFTASWAGLIAQYIIGLAAAMSGALDYAEALFVEVRDRLSVRDQGFLFYTKVQQRIPKHLGEIAFVRARESLKHWYETKEEVDLRELERQLEEAVHKGFEGNGWPNLNAVVSFSRTRNTSRARSHLARNAMPFGT